MNVQAFAMIPVRVILDQSLSHAEFRAFAAVAVHRNTRTGWSFPSHATLAADLGLSATPAGEERVRQLLKPSVDRGYLERVAGGGRVRSRYRVIYDQPAPTPDVLREEGAFDDQFDDFGAPLGTKGTPLGDSQGAIENRVQPPSETAGTSPLAVKGRTIRENYTREELDDSLFRDAEKPSSEGDPFAAFWAAYPKCRRKAGHRHAASLAFARACKVAKPRAIVAGLAAYPWGSDPEFFPAPEVWLNQRRWEVEAADAEPAAVPGEVDPSDDFGARAWAAKLPDAAPGTVGGQTVHSLAGYDAAGVACDVCAAAGLPPSWRGDLSALADWLRAGADPDALVAAVRWARKPPEIRSLRIFAGAVQAELGKRPGGAR